jgi:ElaB/YqjD/DUF883 family membrane-anchored ribosome-binding protein
VNSKNGQDQVEAAAETAAETANKIVADTAERVRSAAATVGSVAGDYAQEAGRQAGVAMQTAYNQGGEAVGLVEDIVRQNPWGAMLVAACVGYGVACLVKNTR